MHLFSPKIIFILFTILLNQSLPVSAQENTYTKEELDRMEMTIAYYLVQLNSIEAISAKFPHLAVAAQDALREWNKEFYSSIKLIDSELEEHLSTDWTSKKDLMVLKYSRADYTRIKEPDAKDYIFEVNKRAVGKIETPVLETLLIFNPQYIKEPDMEFTERYTRDFFSKTNKTALGLDMQLVYPQSWKATSGLAKTGNIQTLVSKYGAGTVSLFVYVEKTKASSSKEKLPLPLKKENITKGLIDIGAIRDYKADYYLDDCKAARVFAYSPQGIGNGGNPCIHELYALIYKDFLVRILFQVSYPSGTEEDVFAEYEKNKLLIRKIKDSLVILSQWGQRK